MREHTVSVTRHTPASVAEVWKLLSSVEHWPAWAPVRGANLEREGDTEREGVGAVRSFRTQTGSTTRERIVAFEPERHTAYVLLSGLPVEDYRSDITLEPAADGGTTIMWCSTFRGAWFWRQVVRLILGSFSRRLAVGAHRGAAAATR